MATPSGRTFRPGGVVRAGLRLVLLVGVGFVSGLLIGVLTEEPELLAGHLRGESEAIVLTPTVEPGVDETDATYATGTTDATHTTDATDATDTADVAALDAGSTKAERSAMIDDRVRRATADGVAREQAERRVAMAPRAEERSTASLPQVSAAQPDDALRDWTIQVGAFSDERAARRLADGLRDKGYPVEVLAASGATRRWRVRVQPIRGEARAGAMSKRLKRDEGLPTWPQPMEGRSAR